jgi:hypothetical protein
MQRGCRLRSCAPMLHSGNDRFVKVIWRGANSLMDSNPRSSDTDNNGIDDYVGRRWFDRSSRYALSRWSDHDNMVDAERTLEKKSVVSDTSDDRDTDDCRNSQKRDSSPAYSEGRGCRRLRSSPFQVPQSGLCIWGGEETQGAPGLTDEDVVL